MNNFSFELNREGVAELLHSNEMEEVLMEYANNIQSRAGKGFRAKQLRTRVVVVEAYTDKAKEKNLKNNTLLKAVNK